MKNCFKFAIIIVVFALLFSTSALASSSTYTISELGLDITIPSGYKVITKDTPASASIFSELGRTKADVIEQFEESKIYLNAISNTLDEEIVVTMDTGMIDNFSALSDTSLKIFASSWVNEYDKMGISVNKYDIYQHSQAKFVRVYFEDIANSVNGLQYYTIYNGKAMNFTMRSYFGEITTKQEKTIKTIVDSVKYDTPPVEIPAGAETEAFVYTDVKTNTKFTVPANWYEKELFKEREFIDVKFVSSKEEGMSIMYGSTDLWEMLTPEEQIGSTRSDLDNSAFEISDIAELYGLDENAITKKIYNNVDYFQATVKQSIDMYGGTFTPELTYAIRIENGWGYWFQFGGTTDNEYFEDFQELLNSVEYPYSVEKSFDTNNKYSALSYYELFQQGPAVYIPVLLIMLLMTLVAYAVFPLIFAWTRKKIITKTKYNLFCYGINLLVMFFFIVINGKSSGSPYFLWTCVFSIVGTNILKRRQVLEGYQPLTPLSQDENTVENDETRETERICICQNCGTSIPDHSMFCHKCGTKIEEGEKV